MLCSKQCRIYYFIFFIGMFLLKLYIIHPESIIRKSVAMQEVFRYLNIASYTLALYLRVDSVTHISVFQLQSFPGNGKSFNFRRKHLKFQKKNKQSISRLVTKLKRNLQSPVDSVLRLISPR